jgi:hypothetical protein
MKRLCIAVYIHVYVYDKAKTDVLICFLVDHSVCVEQKQRLIKISKYITCFHQSY